MKFTVNNSTFRVRFMYTNKKGQYGPEALRNAAKYNITTTAQIQIKTSDGKWEDVGTASTVCCKEDTFVKQAGRKLSFGRALSAVQPALISKEDRLGVWTAYFENHADPKPNWYMKGE